MTTVYPSRLSGTIQAPASKSSMQRACAAAAARKGLSVLRNPGHSKDDLAAIEVIKVLGATVKELTDGSLEISGTGIRLCADRLNTGESGLGMRMFAPLAALGDKWITLEGSGSLLSRPLDFFDEVFPQLGVKVESNQGKLPVRICGPLIPWDIAIDGSLSSQFLTGLLLAYSAAGAGDVTINVNNLASKPYIDLTLSVMHDFRLPMPVNNGYASFNFPLQPASVTIDPSPVEYTVEGDWSGGAFLLVAGAIAGPLTVKGLDPRSPQGDKAVLQALMQAGALVSVRDGEIEVGPASLRAFHFDATDCPDLFPPLVALAAYCEGRSVIEGVRRLAHKESDRGLTLQEEFGKLGIAITLQEDIMIVEGGRPHGASVSSRNDHRIAMAAAVAALGAEGAVSIEAAVAVSKSYPDFFNDLQRIGVRVDLPVSLMY